MLGSAFEAPKQVGEDFFYPKVYTQDTTNGSNTTTLVPEQTDNLIIVDPLKPTTISNSDNPMPTAEDVYIIDSTDAIEVNAKTDTIS